MNSIDRRDVFSYGGEADKTLRTSETISFQNGWTHVSRSQILFHTSPSYISIRENNTYITRVQYSGAGMNYDCTTKRGGSSCHASYT